MFKRRIKQYSLFLGYTVFALIVPIVLIIEKFGLLRGETDANGWLFGGILSIIIILFYLRKHLSKGIENLPPCTTKYFLQGVKELTPLLILYVAFALVQLQMTNLVFIIKWSVVSNAGALWLRTLHLKEVARVIKLERVLAQQEELIINA